MQKLITELNRLYGQERAITIAFVRLAGDGEAAHWERLCVVANALQAQLGLPAPAVSIDGATGYGLWLSLDSPVPALLRQQFMELLCAEYCPEMSVAPDAVSMPAARPPCLHPASGKWAAFIHPGMGAAFADEPGLDVQPTEAGQLAFVEALQSIDATRFSQALDHLRRAQASTVAQAMAPEASVPTVSGDAAPAGLLLKDATLEDIVKFLHSKNIEPTFRHLMPK